MNDEDWVVVQSDRVSVGGKTQIHTTLANVVTGDSRTTITDTDDLVKDNPNTQIRSLSDAVLFANGLLGATK